MTARSLLFSATLPYQIAKAASKYLREPARLDVSGDVLTVDGIDNYYVTVASDLPKPRQLLYVLEHARPSSAIVFCNTRSETETIAKYLCQNGFVAEALSGGFRQSEREKVVERIKSGELRYMVATDIAARGIDIAHLSHVVNYALPEFSKSISTALAEPVERAAVVPRSAWWMVRAWGPTPSSNENSM